MTEDNFPTDPPLTNHPHFTSVHEVLNAPPAGLKHDMQKRQWHLLPWDVLPQDLTVLDRSDTIGIPADFPLTSVISWVGGFADLKSRDPENPSVCDLALKQLVQIAIVTLVRIEGGAYDALESVVEVLEFGAAKYGANNWRSGISETRLWNATLRHMIAFDRGEETDEETGFSHPAHALCEVLFVAALHAGISPESWWPA